MICWSRNPGPHCHPMYPAVLQPAVLQQQPINNVTINIRSPPVYSPQPVCSPQPVYSPYIRPPHSSCFFTPRFISPHPVTCVGPTPVACAGPLPPQPVYPVPQDMAYACPPGVNLGCTGAWVYRPHVCL